MKHVKELCRFAESLGLSTKRETRGNTHIGIKLTHPNGESTTMIIGASISDHRAMLNNRAFIKRFIRQQEFQNVKARL